jgi:hypothetical protein
VGVHSLPYIKEEAGDCLGQGDEHRVGPSGKHAVECLRAAVGVPRLTANAAVRDHGRVLICVCHEERVG